MVVMTVTE